MSTGWTWDYCLWSLDIPRLIALNTYWKHSPPLHLMVAAYLGIKPKEESAGGQAAPTQEELSAFGGTPMPPPKFTTAADYLKQKASDGK